MYIQSKCKDIFCNVSFHDTYLYEKKNGHVNKLQLQEINIATVQWVALVYNLQYHLIGFLQGAFFP